MITFMNNNKNIIGTLSILAMFSVWSNVANASENRLDDSKTIVLEETIEATEVAKSVSKAKEDQLEKYKNAVNLSDKDLKNLLALVGFEGQKLPAKVLHPPCDSPTKQVVRAMQWLHRP